MEFSNWNTKKVNKVVRSLIVLIIGFVSLLMLPILSGFVAMPFILFYQPVGYLLSRIIQNLYGPIIMIMLVSLSPVIVGMFRFWQKNKINMTRIKAEHVVITGALIVIGVSMTFQSFQNLGNLLLDTKVMISSDFEEIEGTLQFYEILSGDEWSTRMEVNHIRFDGGNIQGDDPIEG